MTSITFTIPGKPRGQGRPRATSIGKSARMYKAKNDRLYESRVQEAFYAAVAGQDWKPLTGPVYLTVCALYSPPSSMKKAHREYFAEEHEQDVETDPVHRTQRPDLSNIVKAVEDGLNGLAFVDDKQIVGIAAVKAYGYASKVVVEIEEIGV